jgi:ABC-2 type transport system ATP-binding protein
MLELLGLRRRFGDRVALDDLSLTVPRGAVVGFVGANGAGKTTAMRIVLGLLAADGGDVRWDGAPVDRDVRGRFGYMPEERGLYPKMRAGEQLAYLAALHGADDATARTAAARWLERLGLAERAGDRVEALSLGNQQRVQLAAALVHEPEALVLDEPFSGLDPLAVDTMSGVLRERAQAGAAVLFSSHQLALVEALCDAVVVIAAGRVVASGPVAELRDGGAQGRWRIRVEGAPAGWTPALPGAAVVGRDGADVVVALGDGVGEQALLDAARAAGRVTAFAPERRTLTDLFRSVVEEAA